MKSFKLAAILATSLMCVALKSQASVINVTGNAFNDLGTSTVDLSAKLEWRDFDLTNGRTYCSVAMDLGGNVPAACSSFDNQDLISDAEGWRYASRAEVAQLMINWFGVTAPAQFGDVDVSPELATQFRSVFSNGASYVRAHYLQYFFNPRQALGLYVATDFIQMDIANGDINIKDEWESFGSALVRDVEPSADVPEPTPLALLALGMAGMAIFRRRKT